MIGTALDAYRLDIGSYPNSEEGLGALRKNPGHGSWDGPYLSKEVPNDPWARPYVYRAPGEHGDYDLYSSARMARKEAKEKTRMSSVGNKGLTSWLACDFSLPLFWLDVLIQK